MDDRKWYELLNTESIITPSLLINQERIDENIRTMLSMTGGTARLRPHIKTHKTAEIINMQLDLGIHKFKCATLAEAELLALCGAKDILLAMQAVGADTERFFQLMKAYPNSEFSTLVDHPSALKTYIKKAISHNKKVGLWIDINNGMNRTGIAPNSEAVALYKTMVADSWVIAKGIHVYDGHIRNQDPAERKKTCDTAFETVLILKNNLEKAGLSVPTIIAGGSPTFPFHAIREGVEASPGTTLLWDAGYGGLFPEMKFLPAAVLMTQVISKPQKNKLCLDLGHKWIAPEMGFPRVQFLNLENSSQIGQSEEHLVLECENTAAYEIGDILYAIPMHICPTVAKYDELIVVKGNKIVASWKVAARNQKITI
ncbi:MAG: D-TA family PLP-dependent enzyme [Maribacter sp.]|nr:D-TA family PLP-dependent enzyme [Maribacter sp.]